jgi:asparagine synthase (glutamine-hydrolysing)
MCGIVGFWQAGGVHADEGARTAEAMAARLAHRGPDDSGVWVDERAGLALGHRRLAVVDLSEAGHQPMVSAGETHVLAFNGEIYNHRALRRELSEAGLAPAWRGHSDSETLVEALATWGVERTLQKCAGMFALAVWNRREQRLTLARDRLGEKPLYYGQQAGSFVFGSELKALEAHPDFVGEVDRDALALLLRYKYVPAPYSIYRGIYKLPPGTLLEVGRDGAGEPEAYWSLSSVAEGGMEGPFQGTATEAVEKLEEVLGAAIEAQQLADVPLGALLSGGVDSTTIVALMQARASRPVRTFTIGFDDAAHDESSQAAAIARHLGTDHTETILTPGDALELIPGLPQVYDEPFADSSQLPTLLVTRVARQHVTVALSGDGGDELFGGYNRYHLAPVVWRYLRLLPMPVRRLLGRVMLATSPERWDRWLRLMPQVGLAMARPGEKVHKLGQRLSEPRSIDELYQRLVTEWLDAEAVVRGASPAPTLVSDRARWPEIDDDVARMMALDAMTYLPDDILVKLDRAAMTSSLETRAPFLDHRVVEYSWRLPLNLKIRGGARKWVLRELAYRYVPREMLDRPKMGFSIPLDAWLRGPLQDWAEALLAERRLRQQGYFEPGAIRRVWDAHLLGQQSCGDKLWPVLMFQAWIDRQS